MKVNKYKKKTNKIVKRMKKKNESKHFFLFAIEGILLCITFPMCHLNDLF